MTRQSQPGRGARSWTDLSEVLAGEASAAGGWAHHGLALTSTGELIAFHPTESALLFFDADGHLLRKVSCPVVEAHGLRLSVHAGREGLWVADIGVKFLAESDGSYAPAMLGAGPRVVLLSLQGEVLRELPAPLHPRYQPEDSYYVPTAVAVGPGVGGDTWVADGYGASLVHRFDSEGDHLGSLTGGSTEFNCPHDVFLDDRREGAPELIVADRGNACLQVFDLDGRFIRTVGEGLLTSPSALAVVGEHLVVGELNARVVVLDLDGRLVETIGADDSAPGQPGWPNALDSDGRTIRNDRLKPGLLSSPHGLAVDASGRVFVSEFLLGGRLSRFS